jgi:dTMP kinase
MLVAIEGIDGSGKGTQAERLTGRLRAAGRSVGLLSFPRYEHTLFGRAVGEFLNGRFGSLDAVHPFLAALLYAGDRYESRGVLGEALAQNEVVVLDRYVASNIAHQGAKLGGEQRRELIARIGRIEHEIYALPRPDRTVLFDLPAVEAQKLIAAKRKRTYTDQAADIQEADAAYLESVRQVYLELAAGDPSWSVVRCCDEQGVRPIDEIADEVFTIVAGR